MLASFISWKPCPHYGSHSYAPRSCTIKLLLSTACIHRGGHIVSSMKRRRKRKRRRRRKERRRRKRGEKEWTGAECFVAQIVSSAAFPLWKGSGLREAPRTEKKKKEKKWEIKSGVRGKNGCCPARQISLPPNNRAETHGRCTWKLLSGPPPPPTCPLLFDYR